MSCSTHHFSTENDEMLPKIIFQLITPELILRRFVACLRIAGHLYDCMGHYFENRYFGRTTGKYSPLDVLKLVESNHAGIYAFLRRKHG